MSQRRSLQIVGEDVLVRRERCNRDGRKYPTGRVYRFKYQATDPAGNVGTGTCDFRITN